MKLENTGEMLFIVALGTQKEIYWFCDTSCSL